MKQTWAFIKKEIYHILRDRRTMLLLLGMPIAQIVIFGFAVSDEIRNAEIAVYDNAQDVASHNIIQRIRASRYFNITDDLHSRSEIDEAFRRGKIKLIVVFPQGFRKDLLHTNKAQVQIIADASDPNLATTLSNYITSIVQEYQKEVNPQNFPYQVEPEIRMLYNPELKAPYNFVPGVMGLVLMLISAMMTSVAIVREKEFGTMEVLLVSPLNAATIVISKVVPYLMLSFVNVTTILLLAVFALGMPINGSLLLIYMVSFIFIVTALSLGILISTLTNSQQAAMQISMLGLMLPTMLLSGYIFPTENMPKALQLISNIVPAKWYIIMVKSVMIKGLGIKYIFREIMILLATTIAFIGLSIYRFKIRLE